MGNRPSRPASLLRPTTPLSLFTFYHTRPELYALLPKVVAYAGSYPILLVQWGTRAIRFSSDGGAFVVRAAVEQFSPFVVRLDREWPSWRGDYRALSKFRRGYEYIECEA
ncbi:uncharacterized protein LOC62_07G008936 [Vanrija pseudolonga]|uniref:Uncharacterized protein n=1 Tax=Vanrija pseudolonga TaxID=143232 RepID=A0AAF1BLT3_9TREE|nr:hypothetical protein LOC62_07G008936 [Vanrija pseudolonga]